MNINENLQRIAAAKTAIRNKIYEKGETNIPVDIAIEDIYEYLQNFYYEEGLYQKFNI